MGTTGNKEKVRVKDLKYYSSVNEYTINSPVSPFSGDEEECSEVQGIVGGCPEEKARCRPLKKIRSSPEKRKATRKGNRTWQSRRTSNFRLLMHRQQPSPPEPRKTLVPYREAANVRNGPRGTKAAIARGQESTRAIPKVRVAKMKREGESHRSSGEAVGLDKNVIKQQPRHDDLIDLESSSELPTSTIGRDGDL